jgi:hypothetical protein
MYQQEAVTAADVEPYCQQPRCFVQFTDNACKPSGCVEYVQPRLCSDRDHFAGIAEAVAHNNYRSLSDDVKASTCSMRDDMRAPENIPVFVMLPLDTVRWLGRRTAVGLLVSVQCQFQLMAVHSRTICKASEEALDPWQEK